MAIIMDNPQPAFFKKVLEGYHPQQLGKVLVLIEKGVVFQQEIYALKAKFGEGNYVIALNTSTNTLSKNAGSHAVEGVVISRKKIAAWIDGLYDKVVGTAVTMESGLVFDPYAEVPIPAKKPLPKAQDWDAELKALAKAETAGESAIAPVAAKAEQFLNSGNIMPAPKAGVIALKDAEAIGQKVKGTSASSVYVCIAVNPRVKVAVRKQGTSLSLRVETDGAYDAEMSAIKGSGIEWKDGAGYGSLHVALGTFPEAKMIGSFLYGMGVKFDRQVAAGEVVW